MNLSDLIREYGDGKVQFQNLDKCIFALNMNKGVTKITFGTEQPIDFKGTVRMGLVLWFDRQEIAQIIASSKAHAALQGEKL